MNPDFFSPAPERAGEPPEPAAAALCGRCLGDIWWGEIYGLDSTGTPVCADCLEDEWRRLSLSLRYERMGCIPVDHFCGRPPRKFKHQ